MLFALSSTNQVNMIFQGGKMEKHNKFLFKISIVIILIAAHFANPQFSAAEDTITWMISSSFPPFYIDDGKYKGKGISDELIKLYQKELPEYNHQTVEMNLSRYFERAKRGEKVCYALLLKNPDRETFLHFSIPVAPMYPHVIVIRNENLKYFQNTDSVSLETLFSNRNLRTVLEKERSYGPNLDPIIRKAGGYENISVWVYKSENLFKMAMNRRHDVDYMIETLVSAVYLEQKFSAEKIFSNIPIREESYKGFGYCTCAKTEWGDEIIKKINDILIKKERRRNTGTFWNDGLMRIISDNSENFMMMFF